jgi:ribosomal protein S18 acetylase RimI-like enzyme
VSIIIRRATPLDEPILWQMIFEAAHMAEEGHTTVQAAKERPDLAHYVQHWGEDGDIGVVAIEPEHNQPIGAAWVRLLIGNNKGYGYVDDETPELAIGLLPGYRGQGVGTTLLSQLFEIVQKVYPAVSLNTRVTNLPAVRLYERMGFRKVEGSEVTNWVGGISYNMVVRFYPRHEGKSM